MQAPTDAAQTQQPDAEDVDDTLGETVLSTALIFAQLWRLHLDAADKRALRCVSQSVCALANDAVETLDAEPPVHPTSALKVSPSLTSLAVDYLRYGADVLSAAPLPRLKKLTLWIQLKMLDIGGWSGSLELDGMAELKAALPKLAVRGSWDDNGPDDQ
ncbi:hypothetical protein FOA52_013005 [Chlamydomonas sp. UWO 241]|nr:hypothetical protein FOA52_013005 [Chlamydomonas sp. UWO 241]